MSVFRNWKTKRLFLIDWEGFSERAGRILILTDKKKQVIPPRLHYCKKKQKTVESQQTKFGICMFTCLTKTSYCSSCPAFLMFKWQLLFHLCSTPNPNPSKPWHCLPRLEGKHPIAFPFCFLNFASAAFAAQLTRARNPKKCQKRGPGVWTLGSGDSFAKSRRRTFKGPLI